MPCVGTSLVPGLQPMPMLVVVQGTPPLPIMTVNRHVLRSIASPTITLELSSSVESIMLQVEECSDVSMKSS